jgi:4-carboxymuconolactone decarboxylase
MTATNVSISPEAAAVLEVINPDLVDGLAADLEEFAPGVTRLIIETAYGGLYSRPGVDLKTRQLATVAALTAMGGQTRPQLQANIRHAVAAGASPEEIVEIILQMLIYAGAPAVLNALWAAREVLQPD